jgi:hypothetical protein
LLDGLAPLVDSFRLQSTREIDGSATTFHKDKQALLRLLRALELDFSAWGVAFGGLALHELRWSAAVGRSRAAQSVPCQRTRQIFLER